MRASLPASSPTPTPFPPTRQADADPRGGAALKAVVVLKGRGYGGGGAGRARQHRGECAAFPCTAGRGMCSPASSAALLAQGMPAFEAAAAAVWLHGEAARQAGPGIIADDLPEACPKFMRRCSRSLGARADERCRSVPGHRNGVRRRLIHLIGSGRDDFRRAAFWPRMAHCRRRRAAGPRARWPCPAPVRCRATRASSRVRAVQHAHRQAVEMHGHRLFQLVRSVTTATCRRDREQGRPAGEVRRAGARASSARVRALKRDLGRQGIGGQGGGRRGRGRRGAGATGAISASCTGAFGVSISRMMGSPAPPLRLTFQREVDAPARHQLRPPVLQYEGEVGWPSMAMTQLWASTTWSLRKSTEALMRRSRARAAEGAEGWARPRHSR